MHKTAARVSARLESQLETKLLVSDSNPDGWEFAELLALIRVEFEAQLRELDTRDPEVRRKRLAYDPVIAAMWEAEGRYRVLGPHQS